MDFQDLESLWIEFQHSPANQELRNRLVEAYLPLVNYNAERIWARLPEGVELDDLISAGVFGLMDAIDAFDLSRGVRFETYGVPRIRGAILDYLRSLDWVPVHVRQMARKLRDAAESLQARLGRKPDDNELSEELHISLPELARMVSEVRAAKLLGFDEKWHSDRCYTGAPAIDPLEDQTAEERAQRIQQGGLPLRVATGLNRTERMVIILHCYEELTFREVGRCLDLPESRVEEIFRSLQRRLGHLLPRRPTDFEPRSG